MVQSASLLRSLRYLSATVIGLAVMFSTVTVGAAPKSTAHPAAVPQGTSEKDSGKVDIIQLTGMIDTAMMEQVQAGIAEAPDRETALVIIQVDTPGAIVDVAPLLSAIANSKVPVATWVGPSGAQASGAGAAVVLASSLIGMSDGAHIGPLKPIRLDSEASSLPKNIQTRIGPSGDAVMNDRLSAKEAIRQNVATVSAPTVAEFLARANGKTVQANGVSQTLRVTQLVDEKGKPTVAPAGLVRFRGLTLERRLRHTLTGPGIFLLLLLCGLCLVVFEFFTAGIGLAGVAGAIGLFGAGIGLAELPIRWWALGLILIGILGFAIDVQAMITKAWSMIGAVLVTVGSWFLIDGPAAVRPDWWLVLLLSVGVVAFMLNGMSSMVRARFSTPTIGRTSLIGEVGRAETAVDPDGVVVVRGARWKARTNRATPIAAGDEMRVAEIVGLLLEVEPLEGAARDHRDRRPKESPTNG